MYGAVLWSDRCNGRALIWCEDHGNLAFFNGDEDRSSEVLNFEEGDLVSFKVRDGRGMRLAYEVEVVCADEYPTLAAGLRDAAQGPEEVEVTSPISNDAQSKIVPFDPAGKKRDHPIVCKTQRRTMAS